MPDRWTGPRYKPDRWKERELFGAIGDRDLSTIAAGLWLVLGAIIAAIGLVEAALVVALPVGAAFARMGVLASRRADSIIARAIAAELTESGPEPLQEAA